MKPIHLSLKKKFAVIVFILAFLSLLLFISAINQLKKAKEYNKLYDEAASLTESLFALDSIQKQMFNSLPLDNNFYKTGNNHFVDDINNLNNNFSEKVNKLSGNFFLSQNKKIKLINFDIGKQLKKYNEALSKYLLFQKEKGFDGYGINGKINLITEKVMNSCKQENLTSLMQKVQNIYDLKNQYLLIKESSLINRIQIETDEAKAIAILTSKDQKLTLLSNLQMLEQLIVDMNQLDEAMGISKSDGLTGIMKITKEQIAIGARDLKVLIADKMESSIRWGYFWLSIILIILLLAIIELFLYLEKLFHYPLDKMKYFLSDLVQGKFPESLNFKRKDEISDMAVHLNRLVDGLKSKADFAIEIGKGKLDSRYQPLSEHDILGNALIDMEKSLQKADWEDHKYKNEEKKRIWTNEGIARFGEILRLHNNDINMLADEIILNLVKYLNAAQGGLYFYNDENKDNIHLELVAAFAYDRKKFMKLSVMVGEGLIGTAALEKERIFITDIPEDYLSITSGLGDAPPRCILILPLKLEDEILGVVELASFNIFEPHEIEFVEKIGQTIASTITSVKINARTAKLLEQSQKQAEEMAEQEEEMRQSMEELRTTQEDFARRESEISGFLTAIQNSTMVTVFNKDRRIIEVNDLFLDMLQSKREDIIGRFHSDLSTLGRNGDELDRFWTDLKLGNTRSTIEKIRLSNGKEIFLSQTFSPVIDKNNDLIKVLCISSDVTETKTYEKIIENKTKELEKIGKDLDLLNTAVDGSVIRCEYSAEGRIVYVNDNYCIITGHSKNELVGKISTIYLKEDEKVQFEKIWNEILKDKPYTGSLKRSKPTGEEFWLTASFVPVKDEEGNIKKVFFLALDITERKLKYSLLEEANREIERLKKEKGPE